MSKSEAFNMDCMEGMKQYPDKHFFLAVCDPPYGINRFKNGAPSRLSKYGKWQTVNDAPFTKEMFDEICRVSEHQIVWGYNHLSNVLPPCSEFIFWYKHQPVSTYADGELAYTSFGKVARCFDYPFFGGTGADKTTRVHPTQKPVALYSWLFTEYVKSGGVVLDPFLGSGSSRIAAYDIGLDFVGFEIDKDYFKLEEERFAKHTAQTNLFLMDQENLF